MPDRQERSMQKKWDFTREAARAVNIEKQIKKKIFIYL